MIKEEAQNNTWPRFSHILIWSPIIVCLILPFLIITIYNPRIIEYFLRDASELFSILIGLGYCSIPFAIVSYLTLYDKRNNVDFLVALKNWKLRFIPSFILYLIMIVSIIVTAIKKQPGASTASIALIFFPIMGSLLIFIFNYFIRRRS